MTRFKIKMIKNLVFFSILTAHFTRLIKCSEFPERECCDLTTTTTVGPIPIPPAIPTIKTLPTSSSQAIPTGRSGSNIKTAIAILNCILARQLCFEDTSCSAILEIIPRVCGPVPVACSTVTVTKCQAALRTLQAFPFFRPTCLCKEPGVDPDCNNFRDFLFDHPCGFVLKKEKDPFPVDALPTCNHALSVCQHEKMCNKVYEDFKTHCKVRDNKCRMDDRDMCHESWSNLRMSPMFGCICPNNHMKRRCDRIFSIVNHNPCIDAILLPFSFPGAYDSPSNSVNSGSGELGQYPTFPHFLFPSRRIPLALASHRPAIDDSVKSSSSSNSNKNIYIYNVTHTSEGSHGRAPLNEPDYSVFTNENNHNLQYSGRNDFVLHQHPSIASPRHDKSSDKLHHRRISHQQEEIDMLEIVRKIGMDENYHHSVFDEGMELIRTPLIAPSSTHYLHHHKVVSYPYNITAFQGGSSPKDSIVTNYTEKKSAQDTSADSSSEIIKSHFQSTCHTALEACKEDSSCSASLQPMLIHCELHRCNRNACMSALQSFYKGSHEDLSLDIAFCLCKKTSNRHDICMLAQEKLHPACAQRPPDSINPQSSNGIVYHPPPACHSVADLCKEDPDCRIKLERYEQACAVDSVTKKCAGRPSSCRSAMLGILGTQLRMTCACHGTEFPHLYECLGWQRLLWLNPCVVEAQKDFHMKRLSELGVLFTTSTTTTRAPPILVLTTNRISPIINEANSAKVPQPPAGKSELPLETNYVESPDVYSEHLSAEQNHIEDMNNANEASEEQPITFMTSSTLEIEVTTVTSTTSTTTIATTTTAAPKNCVVQRPHQSDQLVPEGSSRRIYSLDDAECSELCTCGESLTLACHALCVPFAPCRTPLAFYNHASPAYQAFRGRCLCYSGRFICMRPPPGEYILPGGLFLLLGYSSTDEALLRPHTNLGVQDAVRALQSYVISEIDNQLVHEFVQKTLCITQFPSEEFFEVTIDIGKFRSLRRLEVRKVNIKQVVGIQKLRTQLQQITCVLSLTSVEDILTHCGGDRSNGFVWNELKQADFSYNNLRAVNSSLEFAQWLQNLNLSLNQLVRMDAVKWLPNLKILNTACTLTLFNMTDENIIISARLPHDPKVRSIEMLRREKEQCTSILETISHHINSEHSELQAHRLLSIFKMSEVQVIWPENSSSAHPSTSLTRGEVLFLNHFLIVLMSLVIAPNFFTIT